MHDACRAVKNDHRSMPRHCLAGRSNMDTEGGKVSGDGSIFLLLLNEGPPSPDSAALDGKGRLRYAWDYHGKFDVDSAALARDEVALGSIHEARRALHHVHFMGPIMTSGPVFCIQESDHRDAAVAARSMVTANCCWGGV